VKRLLGFFALIVIMTCVSGCIISVSPNPRDTIVMQLNEYQYFTIFNMRVPGANMSDATWEIDRDPGWFEPQLYGPTTFSLSMMPQSVGRFSITCRVVDFIGSPIGPGVHIKDLWSGSRTWTVIVQGVEITPKTCLAQTSGVTQTYTALVYPEGTYTYAWYLDDQLVCTQPVFDFTPVPDQVGHHVLVVTAQQGNTVYTSTKDIYVPLARVGGNAWDYADTIAATADGGYILAGSSRSDDIPTLPDIGEKNDYLVKFDSTGMVWQEILGKPNAELELTHITQTPDGGYIAAEYLYYGEGHILRLNEAGDLVWRSKYGQAPLEDSFVGDLQGTTDGGAIMIEYDTNVLAKLDVQGLVQWWKELSIGTATINAVVQTTDGGYLAVGSVQQDAIPGLSVQGSGDGLIIRLDAAGEPLWFQRCGGSDWDYAFGIRLTSDGGFIVWGMTSSEDIPSGAIPGFDRYGQEQYLCKCDEQGNIQWQKRYGYYSISNVQTRSDGGYLLIGDDHSPVTDAFEGLIIRLDQNGNEQKRYMIGDGTNHIAFSVLPGGMLKTATGGFLVVANLANDIFLLPFDSEGKP
jgi:hypothetical protein